MTKAEGPPLAVGHRRPFAFPLAFQGGFERLCKQQREAAVSRQQRTTRADRLSLPFRNAACTGQSGAETVIPLRAAASDANLKL